MRAPAITSITAVLLLAGVSIARSQNDYKVHRIDLRGHGYLKDVFDAGLRPKHENGLEATRCFAEDRIICFDLGTNRAVTIPAERCDIRVHSTNQSLSELSAESIPLALAETRAWMLPICRTFGRPATELDEFLDKVRKGHKRFGWIGTEEDDDDEEGIKKGKGITGFGAGTPRPPSESDLPSIGASLRYYGADTNRPIQIQVFVYWERPYRTLGSPSTPLQPPQGYESFSMQPDREYTAEWIRKGFPPPANVLHDLGAGGVERLRKEYMQRKGLTTPPVPFAPPPPNEAPK